MLIGWAAFRFLCFAPVEEWLSLFLELVFGLFFEFLSLFGRLPLLEAGTFKIVSYGTGKFGRVLGEIFVSPDAVGHEISENIDRSSDGLVSINDILIEEGHAYEYDGGKKKAFVAEIETEKAAKKEDLVDKPAEEEARGS